MVLRLARPPDPLKHVEQPELLDAGKHFEHALADHFLPAEPLDLLGPVTEIDDDEIPPVVHRLVDGDPCAGMAQNLVELRLNDLQLPLCILLQNLARRIALSIHIYPPLVWNRPAAFMIAGKAERSPAHRIDVVRSIVRRSDAGRH